MSVGGGVARKWEVACQWGGRWPVQWRGGVTKGVVARETTAAPILLHTFFKGSEVIRTLTLFNFFCSEKQEMTLFVVYLRCE